MISSHPMKTPLNLFVFVVFLLLNCSSREKKCFLASADIYSSENGQRSSWKFFVKFLGKERKENDLREKKFLIEGENHVRG